MASFRIDLDNLCLWRNSETGSDERLNLTPKTFDVLRYLVENTGRLVTHDELLTALWPDVHVQPEVLKTHILAVRTALGDDSASPKFIETQRGRGYRFIGQMAGFAPPDAKPAAALDLGVFAGRAEPMRELLAAFEQVSSGQPRAVFISGEPGIGKTTLIEQFLLRIRGLAGLVEAQGHCIEGFAGAEPYYPVFEALRELSKTADRNKVIRALRELAPSWASQMPDQIPAALRMAPHEPALADARTWMVREACNLFETVATEHLLVLVLEDLHWADFATIDFISALCRRRSSARLMLIGIYRPEDLQTARHPLKQMIQDLVLHKYCHEIDLAPLSAVAISEILAGGVENLTVPSEFTQFIKERTGGIPLFMRVTLDYLLERGQVSHTARGWLPLVPLNMLASELPPTLARLIEAEIQGMTDEQRRMLEAASVAGDHFDPVTTARGAEMDEQSFEAICESLGPRIIRRAELLTLPNNQLVRTYTFNHATYRQVLYDRIGEVRRAHLHRAIGDRLEEIYPPDRRNDLGIRLAHHFALARDWSRALVYLRSTLHVASSRFAGRDAMAVLDYATELVGNLPDNARIQAEIELLEWRAVIQTLSNDPGARESWAQLAAKAGEHSDFDMQCRALIGVAYRASSYDLTYSLHILDEVLTLCERLADPIQRDLTRIRVYAERLCGFGWNREDAQKCEELLDRLRTHGNSPAIAYAQINYANVCQISARYQEAHDLLNDSYRVLSATSQAPVGADLAKITLLRNVGVPSALVFLGKFGAALADLGASIAAFEKSGNASAARFQRVYRGAVLSYAMDFEGALQDCGSAALRPLESQTGTAPPILSLEGRIALIFCGLAEIGLGNNTVGLGYLRAAESEMKRQPVYLDWYWRLALEWGVINALVAEGDHPEALMHAQHLCELAAQTDERTWQALAWEARARAALARGDLSEAIVDVANALAVCEGANAPLAEWRVHATSAIIYKAVGDDRQLRKHSQLGAAVRQRLAESLPEGDPVRSKFEERSGSLAVLRSGR